VPGQIVTISDLLVQDMSDAERARIQKMNDAWDAYAGKLEAPLKKTKSDPNAKDNILLNLSGPVVDTGVSFLVGKPVQFEVDGGTEVDGGEEGEEESTADQWLTECLKKAKMQSKLHMMALNGGVCGDVFVKIVPGKPYPRIVVWDSTSVDVVSAPDDFEHVMQYKLQWNGIDPVTKKACAYRQLVTEAENGQSWTIADQKSDPNIKHWQPVGEPVNWPYAWSPIFHCQNLPSPCSYYGVSDLEEHVVEVNDAINFVISNLARIVRIHAHPKTWGKGFSAKELEIGIDETIIIKSATGELQNLEMLSDLSSSLALYDKLKAVMTEIVRVPEVAAGKLDSIGQLSGLAIQIMFQPLLQKNGTKQLLYGEMLSDLCARLLELGGQGEDHTVDVEWPDPLPSDPVATGAAAEGHQRMGIVSKDTLATKFGYDYSQEKGKIASEGQDAGDQLLTAFDRGQTNSSGQSGPNDQSKGKKQ